MDGPLLIQRGLLMNNHRLKPMLQAILAATLFGASPPLAKLLLGEIHPIPLAGFIYLGSGIGLLLWFGIAGLLSISSAEPKLTYPDLPWLAAAILAGGILAPIILMYSLRATPASTASLLLNFEAAATAVMAGLVFREAIGARIWMAIGCITISTILLSINLGGEWGFSMGAVGIIIACLLWGADNNLIRNIAGKDPLVIVTIKGLGAGTFTLLLALVLGIKFPALPTVFACMLLGLLSYGLSIVLFILAMRGIGAARTAALFGTAPFVGVILSFLIFHEPVGMLFYAGLLLMILGALLLLGEKHIHMHYHPAEEHRHCHRHDDPHHSHLHPSPLGSAGRDHYHWHTHEPHRHSHGHTPDPHHRHSH
jgi:drug/metabolite transporter (DMT)-like permease